MREVTSLGRHSFYDVLALDICSWLCILWLRKRTRAEMTPMACFVSFASFAPLAPRETHKGGETTFSARVRELFRTTYLRHWGPWCTTARHDCPFSSGDARAVAPGVLCSVLFFSVVFCVGILLI